MKKETLLDTGVFDEPLADLAKAWYGEPHVSTTSLETLENQKAKQVNQLKNRLNEFITEINEGVLYFIEFGPPSCKEKLRNLSDGDGFEKVLESLQGNSFVLADPLNLNEEDLNACYQLAHASIEDIALARKLFMTLIFFNYTVIPYWLGLAYTYVKEGNDPMARKMYEVALSIDPKNPLTYLYYSKYLVLHKDPFASTVVDQGIEEATELHDEHLLEELKAVQKALKSS